MNTTPTPSVTDFSVYRLHPSILQGIADMGFVHPRPIQAETLPAALDGRDILGLAQTGTGKTAAFGLPILQRFGGATSSPLRALIVAPTRELVLQITAELEGLGRHTALRVATAFGGVSQAAQVRALRGHPQVLVACPGRLLDLLGQKLIQLDTIRLLVLDEADHMLDMGFLRDIRRLLAALPRERQTMMFSATMSPDIRRLADDVLQRPHVVELAHSRPVETVAHVLYPVPGKAEKLTVLDHLLADPAFGSAIIFSRTKHGARRLAQRLEGQGLRAVALQGNMSQPQRVRAMDGFRRGDFNILVATDIAARGIDVAQVSHVINFDIPDTAEAYTHRIGRTGRAERTGRAFTLASPEDTEMVQTIEAAIGAPIPRAACPGVPTITIAGRSSTQKPPTPTASAAPRPSGTRPRGRGRGGRGGRSPAR